MRRRGWDIEIGNSDIRARGNCCLNFMSLGPGSMIELMLTSIVIIYFAFRRCTDAQLQRITTSNMELDILFRFSSGTD